MFSYRICGTPFQSSIALSELMQGDESEPEFTLQLSAETRRHSKSYQWLNHWYSLDGSIWLAFAKLKTGYLLRFPAYADFVVSTDAQSVFCYPRQNCPSATMRHLVLNQVIPIVLSQLGKLVLHASACETSQGVVAFMGTSGMGESTLAASFGLRGFPVLTDDCLLVEEQDRKIVCIPSYAGVRLWPESVSALFKEEPELQPLAHYTDKKRLLFHQESAGIHSLRAVYVLAKPDHLHDENDVNITPLTPSDALFTTVKHTFQLDVTDHEKLGQAFKRYEWLAKSIPFFKLTFPRDHSFLPTVQVAILNHLDLIQDQIL